MDVEVVGRLHREWRLVKSTFRRSSSSEALTTFWAWHDITRFDQALEQVGIARGSDGERRADARKSPVCNAQRPADPPQTRWARQGVLISGAPIHHCNFDSGSDRPDLCRVCCGNSSQAWVQCLELWECIKVAQGCMIPRGTEVCHTFGVPFLVSCPNLYQDFAALAVQDIEREIRTGGRQCFRAEASLSDTCKGSARQVKD